MLLILDPRASLSTSKSFGISLNRPIPNCFVDTRPGFVLHSAIHAARPDIKAIIHIHHPPVVAVSAMKCGLLLHSQESAIVGDISYYDYSGLLVDPEERVAIAKTLGISNKVRYF
jgi:adducin